MQRLLLLIATLLIAGNSFATNTVSGKVTKSTTGNPCYPAHVYLIHKTYSSSTGSYILTLLDSTATDTAGEYHFTTSYSAGDLLVKATLTPSNPDYAHYLATYKENSLTWNNAHAVSFTLGANNIHLAHGTNPGGPAFIGGSVLQGANKSTAVGDPLPAKLITLTNTNDDPIAYAYSDASGNFSFPNLAYGAYKLFGDVWNKDNPELLLMLDAATPSMNNIVFEENSTSFKGQLFGSGVTPVGAAASMSVYPNPVSDVLHITHMNNGDNSVTVTNINGSVCFKTTTQNTGINIPFSSFASGLYVVKIVTGGKTIIYKITR